jgi:hypothetical protein
MYTYSYDLKARMPRFSQPSTILYSRLFMEQGTTTSQQYPMLVATVDATLLSITSGIN